MALYYRGPTNDNFGYDPDLVTNGPMPLGSEDPWEDMEALEWISIDDLEPGDEILHTSYGDTLELSGGVEVIEYDEEEME